jgi:hypothetical protein
MSTTDKALSDSLKFFRTELATARAFLDIAETSAERNALFRNVHNAEVAIGAVRRALASEDLDPVHADEIRRAANTISGRLTRLAAS